MTTDRLTPAELQTAREHMGLTTAHLAAMLDVRDDTVRRWERGREPIPYRVRDELARITAATDRAVVELADAVRDERDPVVIVYRTDAEMHAARPDAAHLPARWWRHVVARATHGHPAVRITNQHEQDTTMPAWTMPTPTDHRAYPMPAGTDLLAIARDGSTDLLVTCTWQDGPNLSIDLARNGRITATTDRTDDWSAITDRLPYAQWPAELGPARLDHDCSPELRTIIDAHIEQNEAELAQLDREDN